MNIKRKGTYSKERIKEMEDILAYLPYGHSAMLAKKFKCSDSMSGYILSIDYENTRVRKKTKDMIEYLLEISIKNKEEH